MIKKIKTLPILPLREILLFPGAVAPILIARESSLNALYAAKEYESGNYILLSAQKQSNVENPKNTDIFEIGTIAKIVQTVNLPDKSAKILVEVTERVKLKNIRSDNMLFADYQTLPDDNNTDLFETVGLSHQILLAFKDYASNNSKISKESVLLLEGQFDPKNIINIISSHLKVNINVKQKLLNETNIIKRGKELLNIIILETMQINTAEVVQKRVKKQIEKTQREYYLNEQMKAIQLEMQNSDGKSDFRDIESKIATIKLSVEAKEKAKNELRKLKMMNQVSAESSVVRNYIETLLSMPWGKKSKNQVDINKTEKILDRDHFGLDKVKERIVEHISVLTRAKKIKGPMLCLIGPPGVGKTSLVKSISEAMGRKYAKLALGGVRDESEIRGHRKTYLGSMPGKIISLIKKTKVNNPVMLLDEIDKMSSDYRGDPSSALLEVLDPEQNARFVDHYLEVEYDLSDIVFIATANSYNLPRPLLDRMEIINIAGYIEEEKLQIAKNYLFSKQLKNHSMKKNELKIEDDTIIELIRYYTRESGVRSLERQIGALARKALTKILKNKDTKSITIKPADLEEYLGPKKYKFGLASDENRIGSTTGLAYSEVGGDLLNIEAVSFSGKGKIKSTGKLGEVMKESVEAAYSCFLSNVKDFNLKESSYKNVDIHLHVPEGATPKDGPSAGIAIYTTIVSLMTKRPVHKFIAMTGEITLQGNVLPIGGLKEKLLAAKRGGIKKVLIPKNNEKDLKEISSNIKDNLEIILVSKITEVLDHALM